MYVRNRKGDTFWVSIAPGFVEKTTRRPPIGYKMVTFAGGGELPVTYVDDTRTAAVLDLAWTSTDVTKTTVRVNRVDVREIERSQWLPSY